MKRSLLSRGISSVGIAFGAIGLSTNAGMAAAAPDKVASNGLVRLIKAGEVFAQRDFQNAANRADLERAVDSYMRDVAYNLKVNKGNTLRSSWSSFDNTVVVTDYLTVKPEDMAAYRKQLGVLIFPEPRRAEYRIRFIALNDFAPGQPLPARVEVLRDESIADKETLLATMKVSCQPRDEVATDQELGLVAFRPFANAVRAKLKSLGVPEPFASERIGIGVKELDSLGAAVRLGRATDVEFIAAASSPIWLHDYTGVEVMWKMHHVDAPSALEP